MQSFRGKLSFSNVVAALALFVALGGSAYAATQLPKNSVGAKQLKKNAVTPAKLSSASKSTLRGPKGDTGPQGPVGPQGLPGEVGKEGPRGPGATTLDLPVGSSTAVLTTVGGMKVSGSCTNSSASLDIRPTTAGSTLDAFGTQILGSEVDPVNVSQTNILSFASLAGGGFDLIARNSKAEAAFTRLDVRLLPETCRLEGTVIPSGVG